MTKELQFAIFKCERVIKSSQAYKKEDSSILERIVIDKRIVHGKPVVMGSRVPVDIVVGSLVGGMIFEEIQEEYGLQLEDIQAFLAAAAQTASKEHVYALEKPAEVSDAEVSA